MSCDILAMNSKGKVERYRLVCLDEHECFSLGINFGKFVLNVWSDWVPPLFSSSCLGSSRSRDRGANISPVGLSGKSDPA